MRRLVVVAAAAARGGRGLDDAVAWLGTLPTAGVSLAAALSEVRLNEADVLWIRGAAEPDPGLLPWLHAGGRLLATLDAALLPVALRPGEPGAGDDHAPAVPAGDFGLAAFGPHPLFTGLRDCAVLRPRTDPAVERSVAMTASVPNAEVLTVAVRGVQVESSEVDDIPLTAHRSHATHARRRHPFTVRHSRCTLSAPHQGFR